MSHQGQAQNDPEEVSDVWRDAGLFREGSDQIQGNRDAAGEDEEAKLRPPPGVRTPVEGRHPSSVARVSFRGRPTIRHGPQPYFAVGARAASSIAFMIGPATPAPVSTKFWYGTTTATAICGLLAGAKPIIQSSVLAFGLPVWAVPVLTAASSDAGKPDPVGRPLGHDQLHQRGHLAAAWGVAAVIQGVG